MKKTGQLASRPGLRRDAGQMGQKTGRPGKNRTGDNPNSVHTRNGQFVKFSLCRL